MINNFSTTNLANNNVIPARKIAESSKRRAVVLSSPPYVPPYSIDKELEEHDIYRKNVIYTKNLIKRREKFFKNLKLILSAGIAATIMFFICKKS